MRKPQNNSDQSAFHLPAAHKDVQLILIMAALEGEKQQYRNKSQRRWDTKTLTQPQSQSVSRNTALSSRWSFCGIPMCPQASFNKWPVHQVPVCAQVSFSSSGGNLKVGI